MEKLKSLAMFVFVIATSLTTASTYAAPGDQANLNNATFVDSSTKQTYNVSFYAKENSDEAGVGGISFYLNNFNSDPSRSRLSLSTMHGANVAISTTYDYSTSPPTVVTATPPFNISLWEQGPAGNQMVKINSEKLNFSAHSFVHSDAPNITFMGPVTADIQVERKSGEIKVVIYTPKGQIKLEGRLSTLPL